MCVEDLMSELERVVGTMVVPNTLGRDEVVGVILGKAREVASSSLPCSEKRMLLRLLILVVRERKSELLAYYVLLSALSGVGVLGHWERDLVERLLVR